MNNDFDEIIKNEFSCHLMIETMYQNDKYISLSKEDQMNILIKRINDETNYEIFMNEKNQIPQYIKSKNEKMYLSNEFIKEFNVNEIIKELIEKQKNSKENEVSFPIDYLTKRIDYEKDGNVD